MIFFQFFSPPRSKMSRTVSYTHLDVYKRQPFIVIPFVNGEITIGPWQNLTLVECDTRNRVRDIVFQVMGE